MKHASYICRMKRKKKYKNSMRKGLSREFNIEWSISLSYLSQCNENECDVHALWKKIVSSDTLKAVYDTIFEDRIKRNLSLRWCLLRLWFTLCPHRVQWISYRSHRKCTFWNVRRQWPTAASWLHNNMSIYNELIICQFNCISKNSPGVEERNNTLLFPDVIYSCSIS